MVHVGATAGPQLTFSGEGHVRSATRADAAAVVLGHEAGNLANFAAIAAARGGFVLAEHAYVRFGYVDGVLTVVGGHSDATIVYPKSASPNPQIAATAATAANPSEPGAPPAGTLSPNPPPQPAANVDLLSPDGSAPASAPPPGTSFPPNATLPAFPVESSATPTVEPTPPPASDTTASADESANLDLTASPAQQLAADVAELPILETDRAHLAYANEAGQTATAYQLQTKIYSDLAVFNYQPFATVGRNKPLPFTSAEVPNLFLNLTT